MEVFEKYYDQLELDELYKIMELRSRVFVLEQKCLYQDLDGLDKKALHLYIRDKGRIVAYLRILEKGLVNEHVAIGRVLSIVRGQGLAKLLLERAIEIVSLDWKEKAIYLEAQVYIKGLYQNFGFKEISDVFLEDGIPHVQMLLEIK